MGHALKKEELQETSWLRNDHFRKGRSESRKKTPSTPPEEERVTKYTITRRNGEKTSFVYLCKEESGELVLKLGCGIRYPVTRETLQTAIMAGKKAWQRIRLDTESIEVSRSDLRDALRELDRA